MLRHAPLLALLALAACEDLPTAGTLDLAASATAPSPACGLSDAALGTPIDSAAGYTVHDTAPGSTAPRVHNITGFSDGCARPVVAALALLGDPAVFEATPQPQSLTGRVYDQIRSRICGVPRSQPCGNGLGRLRDTTAFLTLYPAFGAEQHTNLLLHGGEVVAMD